MQDVIELSLTVQTPVTGYPVAGQGFWKKYPVASAPTYRIVSGTAPGLEISPVDVAVSTDGSDGSDSGDGPKDGDVDGPDSGTTDGKDGSGGGPKDEQGEIDAADSDGSDGWLDGPDSDGSDGLPDQEVYRGVKIVGTPTAVGVYSFEIDEVSESGTRRLTLTINVVKDTASRDAVSYYTNLANDAGGYDTFYWAALRGYWLGIGLNDESLAGYNYYSCLGGYYYTYYIETQPQYAYYFYYVNQANAWYTYYASTSPNHAAYQYFYNYALATYYLYYYSGDTQSAAYFYNLYISYANSVL